MDDAAAAARAFTGGGGVVLAGGEGEGDEKNRKYEALHAGSDEWENVTE